MEINVLFSLQVVNGSEILEMLHQLPDIKEFLMSFYDCHYDRFFVSLGKFVTRHFYQYLTTNHQHSLHHHSHHGGVIFALKLFIFYSQS